MKKSGKKDIRDILALTPLQEGMLFHYLKEPASDHYFEQLVLTLAGEIQLDHFKKAWAHVVQANEALRTFFRWEKLEKPAQVVLKHHQPDLVFFDLSALKDDTEKQNRLEKIKGEDRQKKFDLRQVPFRVLLCKVSDRDYRMVISNHHILYDGWSTGIIVKEFFQAYAVLAKGEVYPATPVKPPSSEFIRWNQNQDRDKQKKFWEDYFKGFDTQTPLPIKREVIKPDHEGAAKEFHLVLENELKESLDGILKERHVTLAAFFYCAWGLLLQKYCDSNDVIFGTTVSGRSTPINGIENMVGLLINTIPLRIATEPGEKIKDLVERLNDFLAIREKYESTSLVDIKGYTELQNNQELFDSIVVLENYPLDRRLMQGNSRLPLVVESYSIIESTPYPLTVGLTTGEAIEIRFIFDSLMFENPVLSRLASHFMTILTGILDNFENDINCIELLTGEEKQQILVDFNNTQAEYPRDKTLHELFEKQVEKTPDHIAIFCRGRTRTNTDNNRPMAITYRELNEQSNRLAHLLQQKGIVYDSIAAIMIDRSFEMITGIMSILKAGGAYLPIDPEYPEDRIDYMLKDSGVKILVTTGNLANEGKKVGRWEGKKNIEILFLETHSSTSLQNSDLPNFLTSQPPNFPLLPATSLAYIIYTSGSTGKPKGVLIEQRSAVNYIWWAAMCYVRGERVNFPLYTSISFDLTVTSIFTPLITGNAMVIYGENEMDKGLLIERIIEEDRVGVVKLTPSHLKMIRGKAVCKEAMNLKRFIVGGENLDRQLALDIHEVFKGKVEIYNEYGPTEATVGCMIYKFDHVKDTGASVSIGLPVDNAQVYILDKHQKPVPTGVTGELHISGAGIARGYLNRPELTSEKFCPVYLSEGHILLRAKSQESRAKFYRTGDLARWLPDGNIEFIGRIDHQVKIRGFRIELGEIETCLLDWKKIKEVVVIARESTVGDDFGEMKEDRYICAYFVAVEELSDIQVREYSANHLPDYMIPSYFVQLEKLPLNPNGKVDRKALPLPKIKASGSYVAPRDEIEKQLVKIWAEVLNVEEDIIGIDANFFHLGGHSLKATILAAKISKKLNVELPLEMVFTNPQIRKIADRIRKSTKAKFFAIEPVEKKESYPLSSAQSRMYIIQQMELENISYNMSLVLELEGQVEVEKLDRAFNALVKRHESLRTYFVVAERKPVQRVHEEVDFGIEYYDAPLKTQCAAPGVQHEEGRPAPCALCYADIMRDAVRPFDLSHAPLLRIGLVKTPGAHHFLMMDMHHIICDGVSYGILVKDFKSLAEGKELTPLKIQYKDFSGWQNKLLVSGEIKKQEEYWLKLYKGDIPQLDLPTDFERPQVHNFAGGEVSFGLSGEETAALSRLALNEEVTLYMLLLALYNVFLSKLCNREDILVGTSTAGRRHADLETVCGMFVNTLCLRNYPGGERTFGEFLHEVKQRTLEAFENQDYQFEELVEKLAVKRIPGRNPLFNVNFSFHNEIESDEILEIDIAGLKMKPYKTEITTSHFDLTLQGTETDQKLFFSFHYSTALFEKESIEMFTTYFKRVVSSVIKNPRQRIYDIKIIPELKEQGFLGRIGRQVKIKVPPQSGGKIDFDSLPLPGSAEEEVESGPLTEIERTLVAIWSEVLEIDESSISVNDSFTDLDGQSLKAIMMSSQIHKEFNVSIPIHVIFEFSNIKRLAEYIKKAVEDKHLAIEPAEKKEYYVLSPGQKRIYILMQMEEETIGYNVPQIFTLEGKIDIEKLEDAFNQLIKRHKSLSTSFKMVGEEPVQRIHEENYRIQITKYKQIPNHKLQIPIKEVPCGQILNAPGETATHTNDLLLTQTRDTNTIEKEPPDPKSQELRAKSYIKDFIRPFDLSKAPLLRAGLVEIGERKCILMVDMHHIISDAASRRIFLEEFLDLYEGKVLPALRLQYKDYSEWVNRPSQREVMKRQGVYWLEQFEGELPILNLPIDFPRPTVQSFEGGRVWLSIGKKETAALQKLAMEKNATMFMILLAVFNIFLSKISGQEDIIVGSPVVGRRHTDLQKIIGIFVNTLALRNYPRGEKTFNEFLNELRTGAFNAFENQQYQFEDLVERVSIKRDVSRNPLLDVMFSYQEAEKHLEDIPRKDFSISDRESLQYEYMISKFDLSLGAIAGEELYFGFEYCTKLFKRETNERFLAYFKKILLHIMADPGVKLSEIEIIPLEEKRQVLYDFNDTKREYPEDKTIYQLFEEQAEKALDNIALHGCVIAWMHGEEGSITYNELNEKSNRLAGLLIEKGVKEDDIVGIMMERSVDMVIGIMGILKSGGAYLPIDPGYPQERIDYMLKDSAVKLLVTTINLSEAGEMVSRWEGKTILLDELIESLKSNAYPLTFLPSYLRSSSKLATGNRPPATGHQPPATSLVYIIYTSGSTGRPKGIAVEHSQLVNFIYHMYNRYEREVGVHDRCLGVTNVMFDVSVWEFFLLLSFGAKLVLLPEQKRFDVFALTEAMVREEITIMYLPPGLLPEVNVQLKKQRGTVRLNKMLVGVEPIRDEILEGYMRLNPGMKIINGYGPTETTICATSCNYLSHEPVGEIVPIGVPLSNNQVVLMDAADHVVPKGIVGEICISGDGVSRGYLNNPEMTAEKYVAHPYFKGKRMYRTGDLGRLLPDPGDSAASEALGPYMIKFQGRLDHQVKIRGYRIEPGEIEKRLLKHHHIKEALVLPLGDEKGGKYLCAYIVPDGITLETRELREYLSGDLPEYMIPSHFVALEKISLTPNGKVDRRALPKPELKVGESYTAPRNKIEKKLAALWSEILGRDSLHASQMQTSIGIDDNFFELGGHSLKATILVSRIEEVFNVKIPLSEIFKNPRIRELAGYIKDAVRWKYEQIELVEKKEYYVLSSAQKRLYFLQQMDRDGTVYNISAAWILEGIIDKPVLEESIRGLIRRHESLKTSIEVIEEEPIQRIHEHVEFEIEYYDLATEDTSRPAAATKKMEPQITLITQINKKNVRKKMVRKILLQKHRYESVFICRLKFPCLKNKKFAYSITEGTERENYKLQNTNYKQVTNHDSQITNKDVPFGLLNTFGDPYPKSQELRAKSYIKTFIRPFDLSQAPMLRVELIKIEKYRHIFLVDMHHIISDGISSQVLVQDFSTLYSGKELPEIKVQYKDYAEWQNWERVSKKFLEQGDYWKKVYEGEISVLELPADYKRPAVQCFEGNSINFEINSKTSGALKSLALEVGATFYIVLLALYNIFLAKISGQEDIVIGTPTAGRRHADLEKIIGMFVNTLALRNYPSGEKGFMDFLGEVKEIALKSFENQEYQYEDLVEQIPVNRDSGRNPLFDTMFVLQNTGSQEIEIPGLKLLPYEYESKTSKFDLALTVVEVEGKLHLTFEYSTKLFKRETVERFIIYFVNIIRGVVENRQKRISDIEIITEEEKGRILFEFNDIERGYPKDKALHQLFEEQAKRIPDNIALHGCMIAWMQGEEGSVTYKELNEQSNRLAWWLIEKGILEANIVGIMVERSVEMVVGIMGILKSSGAYLPIDPDYPQERIDYMLTQLPRF